MWGGLALPQGRHWNEKMSASGQGWGRECERGGLWGNPLRKQAGRVLCKPCHAGPIQPFRSLKQVCWCFCFRSTGVGESQPSECKAMAGKGSTGYSINLPYRDLASEVMRRRITMTRRYSWDLRWGLGWGTHADARQRPRTASRFRLM